MNEEILQRLRDPQLRVAMRGYDRLEVDAMLSEIAERIEAGELTPPAPSVAGELRGISERVESILTAATEAADHLRAESTKRAEQVTQEAEQAAEHARHEADSYATETRGAADSYAKQTRTAAEQEATELREETARLSDASSAAAEEQAAEIVREAELERDRVKASIAGLREQRQAVVDSIERLRGNLGSMVGDVEAGTEQFIAVAGEETDEEETLLFEDEEPLTGERELADGDEEEDGEYYEDEELEDETDEHQAEPETGEEELEYETADYDRVEQHADEEWIGADGEEVEAETELLADDETGEQPPAAGGDTEVLELPEDDRPRR